MTDRSTRDNGDRARIAHGPSAAQRPVWPAFVLASCLSAIFGGFLLGGFLLLLRSISSSHGDWQAGAIQAHGHVQVFGWGGLMVLGIALHFLPRLLSARVIHARLPWLVLAFMCAGLLLRVIAGPVLSTTTGRGLHAWAAGGLVSSAVSELIAISIATGLVSSFFRQWRQGASSVPSPAVAGLITFAFASLGAALLFNLAGAIKTPVESASVIPFWADDATVTLALSGFLTSISVAMSARLFPLYVQTRLPRERWLRLTALTLVSAVVFRCIGIAWNSRTTVGIGEILLAAAMTTAIIALNVFQARRQLPRRRVRILTDALQLHVVSAYLWLAFAAILAALRGVNQIGLNIWNPSLDAERHALGAGFITLLILGIGSEMLPGLARARLRRPGLRWATLVLANAAALVRVGPLLIPVSNTQLNSAIMSIAGLLGTLAIIAFLANLRLPIRAIRGAGPASTLTN